MAKKIYEVKVSSKRGVRETSDTLVKTVSKILEDDHVIPMRTPGELV